MRLDNAVACISPVSDAYLKNSRYLYSNSQHFTLLLVPNCCSPIPVAVRCKALVRGRPIAGIVISNPADGMDVLFLC